MQKKLTIITALFVVLHFAQAQQKIDSLQKIWVDSLYQNLSIDDKIAQLFIVAAYTNKDETHEKFIESLVENEHIGGLIFMQDNAEKQLQFTNKLQKKSKIKLLIGIDGEWDLSMRLKNTFKFPYNMTLGAITNDSLLYVTGKKIAQHCRRVGITWNFAPVVDVNTNPNNPIIGNRSYGSDVQNVTRKAIAFSDGMKSENVLASAKHFPGHGDTSSDSHKTTPTVAHNRARLDSVELFPYKKLIENNISGIMVAHLDVPSLETNNLPSSISKKVITDLLKNELQYKGLIITDALNMEGVAKQFPPGIVDVKAFEAGNDLLLFSQNVKLAKEKIKDFIIQNPEYEKRLEESVKKILSYKYQLQLTDFQELNPENLYNDLNDAESVALRQKLYENAITLVKNENSLPLKTNSEKIYYIQLEQNNDEIFVNKAKGFAEVIKISSDKINEIPDKSKVIVAVYKNTSSPYNSYKLEGKSLEIIKKLSEKSKVNLVLFTNPYALKNLPTEKLQSIIIAYENTDVTQKIVAQQLFGSTAFVGKLPVTVNEKFKANDGIVLEKAKNVVIQMSCIKRLKN